jgi:hypothetical protein
VSPVKYELGFYITEDGILHSHRRVNLTSYNNLFPFPGMEPRPSNPVAGRYTDSAIAHSRYFVNRFCNIIVVIS